MGLEARVKGVDWLVPGARAVDEILACAGDARADGAYAHAGNFGGFLVGIAQDLGEDEGFAAVLREGIDKRTGVDPFGPCGGGFAGGRASGGVFVLGGGLAGTRHVVPDVVYPHASGEGEQPGARGRTGSEAGECAHDSQIRFLCKVVSDLRSAEVGDEPPHVILGGADELRESCAVATAGLEGQVSDACVISFGVVFHPL